MTEQKQQPLIEEYRSSLILSEMSVHTIRKYIADVEDFSRFAGCPAEQTEKQTVIAYKEWFKLTHYGFDAVSQQHGKTDVYASGNGRVLRVGKDSVVGNLVVVRYTDALNHKTGNSADVIMRYFHLSQICVRVDEEVIMGTKLGDYGNTGQYSTGAQTQMRKFLLCFWKHSPSRGRSLKE